MRVCFLHTVVGMHGTFTRLARQWLPPETAVTHIADESLIQQILAANGLTDRVRTRVLDHVTYAEAAGADLVQFTCSSITPLVAEAGRRVSIPVRSIDGPMVRDAVARYGRIGVIATNPATLTPSTDLVRATAAGLSREVEVTPVLCEGAYDALFAGDMTRHDTLVREHLRSLIARVDVVLLAQASMARVAEGLEPAGKRAPVLTSPEPAVRALGRFLAAPDAAAGE